MSGEYFVSLVQHFFQNKVNGYLYGLGRGASININAFALSLFVMGFISLSSF